MSQVTIHSVDTSAKFTFSNAEGDYFTATYESPDLRVSKRVWGYTDCGLLVDLFEYMTKEWKGWKGEKDWASIEGELSISCASDNKGHIRMNIRLTQFEGPEPWRVEAAINLEVGLIEGLAENIRGFFPC